MQFCLLFVVALAILLPECYVSGSQYLLDTTHRMRRSYILKGTKVTNFKYVNVDDMEERFVDAHNLARSTVDPPASDMVPLVWDEELAGLAREFVKECVFAHSTSSFRELEGYDYPVGENLFTGMSIASSHTQPEFITEKWDEERAFYDFDTPSCQPGKMCGHYTQVVWSTTRKVGCAIGQCPSVSVGGQPTNFDILVACHYGPNGNWRGEQPYKEGSPCDDCPSDMNRRCENNLCIGK